MRIALISASNKQPAWVQDGFEHYARRLRGSCRLELKEVALARRGRGGIEQLVAKEGERMRAAVPPGAHVVALEVAGGAWTTPQLAARLEHWMQQGRPVALLLGGPDGLAPSLSASAAERWSLSALTLPHGLVRIVVAEALYRAWTVLQGHPYHRG